MRESINDGFDKLISQLLVNATSKDLRLNDLFEECDDSLVMVMLSTESFYV